MVAGSVNKLVAVKDICVVVATVEMSEIELVAELVFDKDSLTVEWMGTVSVDGRVAAMAASLVVMMDIVQAEL